MIDQSFVLYKGLANAGRELVRRGRGGGGGLLNTYASLFEGGKYLHKREGSGTHGYTVVIAVARGAR